MKTDPKQLTKNFLKYCYKLNNSSHKKKITYASSSVFSCFKSSFSLYHMLQSKPLKYN